jgi:hypothetical protein
VRQLWKSLHNFSVSAYAVALIGRAPSRPPLTRPTHEQKIGAVRSDLSAPGAPHRRHPWLCAAAPVVALMVSGQARADLEMTEAGEDAPVEIHAFVSQGFIKTTANNYLAKSERGSFELNEVGINFTKLLGDRLRLGMQLFSRDLGPIGDYRAKLDWFYLDYRLADWLGLRAGRVKLPFGLYNDINDIDAARVPILLPQGIYAARTRDLLLAQTGFELYGYRPMGAAGGLDYRFYFGTIFIDVPAASALQIRDIGAPYVVGGRLMWDSPLEGLRAGGSVQALRIDFTLPAPGMPNGVETAKLPAVQWVGSLEYTKHDLLIAAEYSRWATKIESATPALARGWTTSERFYVMASRRLTPWLTPGAYYSALFPDTGKYSLFNHGNDAHQGHREDYQHDVALTLRFDLTAHWLLKLEGHFMRGTADLETALNDGTPLKALTRDWGSLLAKTTAYF